MEIVRRWMVYYRKKNKERLCGRVRQESGDKWNWNKPESV